MRLHNQPLLKPRQQTDERGFQKYFQTEQSWIQSGDYVETPKGAGYVEETRYYDDRRQFRIEGQKRWHDEKQFVNRLDFAGYLYRRFHD